MTCTCLHVFTKKGSSSSNQQGANKETEDSSYLEIQQSLNARSPPEENYMEVEQVIVELSAISVPFVAATVRE